MHRRQFLASALAPGFSSLATLGDRPRRIVLRSSWQTVNIGDMAHTPGVLALLEKHLPDVRTRVAWRPNYWLTDEAVGAYVRSAGLFGAEMHSPIMCISSGIPAIVRRWAEQTNKGFMWRDIGLNDWLFDLDKEEDLKRVVPTVLAMAKDPAAAKAKAEKAREIVRQRQKETFGVLAAARKKAQAG